MRIASFSHGARRAVGIVRGDAVIDAREPGGMDALYADWPASLGGCARSIATAGPKFRSRR